MTVRTGRRRAAWVVVVAIGGLAAALGATAYGATQWIESRVEQQLEATFAALRTKIGIANYGSYEFNPWTRSITIHDIVLTSPRRAIPETRIRQLVLSGLPVLPADTFSVGRIEAADLEFDSGVGTKARVARLMAEDVNVTPSGFGPDAERLLLSGTAPAPSEALAAAARIAENVRIARVEIGEFAAGDDASSASIQAVRVDDFRNGRLAVLTFEGMRLPAARQAVTVSRLTLRGLDYAAALQEAAQMAQPGAQPDMRRMVKFYRLLESVELVDLIAPDERSGGSQTFQVATFKASWGQLSGSFPTTSRVSMTATAPIGPGEPDSFKALRDAGRRSITFTLEAATAWSETTRKLTVDPVSLTLDDLFSASLVASVDNFSLNVAFSDPAQFAPGNIEAGSIQLIVHDEGVLDFAIRAQAKQQGLPLETTRRTLIEQLYAKTRDASQQSPELQKLIDAFGQFMATNHGTLQISLEPKGHVNVMQLLDLAKTDPASALARFTVDTAPSSH
jgi:hypothetical protein